MKHVMNYQSDKNSQARKIHCFFNRLKPQLTLICIFSLILFLSGCQQSTLPNLNPCFSINAVAGIPSHETIQADAFEDAAGRIRFKESAYGQIRLFLPVINSTGQLTDNIQWNRFKMLYLDPDGSDGDYSVSSTLQYLDGDGSTPIVAELNSNDHVSANINTMSAAFSHDFDFTNRYYYVEIKIFRKNTKANPWIGGLSICEQFQ